MPELPEVETVRRGLAVGRRPDDRRRRGAAPAGGPPPPAPAPTTSPTLLAGRTSAPSSAAASTCGCRSTTATRCRPPRHERPTAGAAGRGTRRDRTCGSGSRFADGGPELRFVDQRTFGGLAVSRRRRASCPPRSRTSPATRSTRLRRRRRSSAALRRRRTGVKRALLDQTLISGVGNIYADEALWRARLHGARPTDELTRPAGARGCSAHVRDVLAEALGRAARRFDALYVNVNGESGYFDRSLNAYGREGEPCRRCGTPDPAGGVHEPVVVLLPALPAAAAAGASWQSVPRRSRCRGGLAARVPSVLGAAGRLPAEIRDLEAETGRPDWTPTSPSRPERRLSRRGGGPAGGRGARSTPAVDRPAGVPGTTAERLGARPAESRPCGQLAGWRTAVAVPVWAAASLGGHAGARAPGRPPGACHPTRSAGRGRAALGVDEPQHPLLEAGVADDRRHRGGGARSAGAAALAVATAALGRVRSGGPAVTPDGGVQRWGPGSARLAVVASADEGRQEGRYEDAENR